MSWWAMSGLNHNGSLEEQFEMIAEAGFDGINGFIPPSEEEEKWIRLLERYGLTLSVNAYPKTSEDMAQFLERAHQFGRVQHINVQVMRPFLTGDPAVQMLREISELSRKAGIPAYIETHRGTMTQDLMRTVQYIERVDELRLTMDLSHYVLAGEMHSVSDEAEAWFQRLLTRSAAFHARMSNGEQIQVDVGRQGEHPMTIHFERWWSEGMRNWLSAASEGDVLPFVIELGPPPYAITVDEYAERKSEISDRWEQSQQLQSMIRKLWEKVQLA
ncbi:TIM barrel protein [Paenibacillus lemnae]|uniref:TIM barrel protein n=2 Tax=Paenibacillus lemnae TaxID=1330551 RepID=A0A848MCK5_PAELE|nr:TIM barrel protein [Paenibacillus lemnae]